MIKAHHESAAVLAEDGPLHTTLQRFQEDIRSELSSIEHLAKPLVELAEPMKQLCAHLESVSRMNAERAEKGGEALDAAILSRISNTDEQVKDLIASIKRGVVSPLADVKTAMEAISNSLSAAIDGGARGPETRRTFFQRISRR